MSEKITYLLKALVEDGPVLTATNSLTVDAYDKITAVVKTDGPLTVDVQPAAGGQFLVILASDYENLSYEVDSSGTSIDLDGPLFLIGPAALGLLGSTQQQFEFTNGGSADITVDILVGRDATPTPPSP